MRTPFAIMKILGLSLLFFTVVAIASDTNQITAYNAHHPRAYRDPDSGVIFYIESDGQHIAAISPDGKLLWNRDPFIEAHLQPYRTSQPKIVWVGQAQKWTVEAMSTNGSGKFIGISYNSSQFGVVDIKTGDFTFMGQD